MSTLGQKSMKSKRRGPSRKPLPNYAGPIIANDAVMSGDEVNKKVIKVNEALADFLKLSCPSAEGPMDIEVGGGSKPNKKTKKNKKIMRGGGIDSVVIMKTLSHLIVLSVFASVVSMTPVVPLIKALFNLIGLPEIFDTIYPIIQTQLATLVSAGAMGSLATVNASIAVGEALPVMAKSAAMIGTALFYGKSAAKTNVNIMKGILRVMAAPTTIFKEIRCALSCGVESGKTLVKGVSSAASCSVGLVKLTASTISRQFAVLNEKLSSTNLAAKAKAQSVINRVKTEGDVTEIYDGYMQFVEAVERILALAAAPFALKTGTFHPDQNFSDVLEQISLAELTAAFNKLAKANADIDAEIAGINADAAAIVAAATDIRTMDEVRKDLGIKPEEITCIPCTETPRAPLMRAPSTQTESQTSQYFLDEVDMEVGGGRKRKRSNSRTKKQRRSLHKKRRATRKMRRR
jgi:hypothetical protein